MKWMIRGIMLSGLAVAAFIAIAGTASAQQSDMSICASSTASPDDAIAACTRLIESGKLSDHDLAVAYVLRASEYTAKKEDALALADDSRAIAVNPQDAVAFLNRGIDYSRLRRYREAIADDTTAIRLGGFSNHSLAGAYDERAFAYLQLHRYREAIADETAAIRIGTLSNKQLAKAHLNRAYVYSRMKKYAVALADDTKAIGLNPRDAVGYMNRSVDYASLHHYRKAIADDTTAIRLDRKAIADATTAIRLSGFLNHALAKAYDNRAFAYRKVGKKQQAFTDASTAIRLDPRNASSFSARVFADIAMARYAQALADITSAIHLDPSQVSYYETRGDIDSFLGRFANAIPDFRRSIANNRAYVGLWLFLAQTHVRQSGAGELAGNTASLSKAAWPSPVIAFYLGRSTRARVLAAATHGNATTRKNQACEAAFYLGEWELLHGETSTARIDLRRAVSTCPSGFIERYGARAELAR